MTEMTVLNGAAIEELLTIPMAVEAVEQAYLEKSRGGAALWPMVFHEFDPGHADLDIKSGNLDGLGFYGLKVVSWFGANPDRGLPALYGTSLLFDLATGAPKALLNAGPITDFRTGAAGAIGAKYLARPDAETLLMAGTGALAPYLIAASLYLLPQLKTVYVTNPHHPAHEPFLKAEWVQPGTHISCIGADMSGKQEVDSALFAAAKVFGDDTAQCLSAGECEVAYKTGVFSGAICEIGQVISGAASGRTSDSDVTIFDSTGIALQDIATAASLLQAAQKAGKGKTVTL